MDNKFFDKHVLDQILFGAFTSVNENWKNNNVGMMWSGTITMAFIIELVIKYMLQEEDKVDEIPRSNQGHNLSFLYNLLERDTKQRVQKESNKIHNDFFRNRVCNMESQVKTILKNHATIFNNFRYDIFNTNMKDDLNVAFNELRLTFMAITNNTDLDIQTRIQNRRLICKSTHQSDQIIFTK